MKHIKEEHKKFHCAYIGDKRNKKRHMKSKHAGYPIEATLPMKDKEKRKNICNECQERKFFCKSTLNRHMTRVLWKNSIRSIVIKLIKK